jgi:hypothetical protein
MRESVGVLVENTETTVTGDSTLNFEIGAELESGDTVKYNLAGFRFATVSYFTSKGCDQQLTTPTQKFTELVISSSTSYVSDSAAFQAGESLKDLFLIQGLSEHEDITGYNAFHNFPFHFQLRFPPKDTSLHDFTFFVRLDDGTTFTANTEPLYIAP